MKTLSNTECELKKKTLLMEKCGLLSRRRFSYLPPFNHDIITQNATNSNIYIHIYIFIYICTYKTQIRTYIFAEKY